MDWRFVIAPLVILLLVSDQAEGLCSEANFILRSMTVVQFPNNKAQVYCTNFLYEQFNNGRRTMIADCSVDEPLSPDIICIKPSGDLLPNCEPPGPVPSGVSTAFRLSIKQLSGIELFVFMRLVCSDPGKTFISGETEVVTECIGGNWTSYNEWCELPCPVPRDCSEIGNMSDGSSGLYRVIPSGSDQDEAVDVWCEMTGTTQGGGTGWTTLYRHVGPNFSETNLNYTIGFGDPELTWTDNSTYFAGLETLVQWNSNPNLVARDLVLQFLLADLYGIQYHATYGSVRIQPQSYALNSVGQYHGSAGNALVSHLGMTWNCSVPSICWWNVVPGMVGINFTSTEIRWKDMPLSYIHIRVRPTLFDIAEGCPTQFRGEKTEGTAVDLPLSRLPNTTFSYACRGDFQLTPREANITCVGLNGLFSWDAVPDLPCKYVPPPGFTMLPGNSSSVKAVDAVATGGVVAASSLCGDDNSSLLIVDSLDVLVGMTSGIFYYTAHIFRNGSVIPPLIPGLNCSALDICQANDTYACIVVDNKGTYRAVACNGSQGFLCSHPGRCISGYSLHRGQCYRIIGANGDMHQALDACVGEGSALAYPETMSSLEFLTHLLTAQPGANHSQQDIIIALQNWNGSYAGYNGQTPDPDVIAMASGLPDRWYKLTVRSDGNFSLSQSQLTGGTALFAACHYLGLADCRQDPLPSDITRNSTWDGFTRALKTTVNYTCAPDTYAGEAHLTNQVSTCHGQLGGWSGIQPCAPANFCLSEFPPAPPNVTLAPNVTSRGLNGVVPYHCLPGMATDDGNTTQIVKCLQVSPGVYAFQPDFLRPCNVCLEAINISSATMNWNTSTTWRVGDLAFASCLQDHRVAFGVSNFTVGCTPLGWQVQNSCYEACTDPPALGTNVTMEVYSSDALNTTINFTCQAGYYLPQTADNPALRNATTATCMKDPTLATTRNVWASPDGPIINCVKFCLDDPPATSGLITTTWDRVNRTARTQFTYGCPDTLVFGNLTPTWNITCQADGLWTPIDLNSFVCRKPAPSPPPLAPFQATLVTSEVTFWDGSVVNYTCRDDQMSPLGVRHFTVTCGATGWTPEIDPEFVCLNICLTAVPDVAFTTNNKSQYGYWDTVVEFVADSGYLFPDYTTVQRTKCSHGNWTLPQIPLAQNDLPPVPTSPPGSFIATTPPYPVGSSVNYTCPGAMRFPNGEVYTTVTRTETGWTQLDPTFVCLNVCLEEPYYVYGNISYNYTSMATWGTAIEYRCNGQFHGGNSTVINYCQEGGTWSLFYIPYCISSDPKAPVPPTPPPPPPSSPNANVLDQAYEITATTHMPSLQEFMKNSDPTAPDFALTDGPFGFGYAVSLQSDKGQCLKRSPFATSDDCTQDPNTCKAGFSLSIWERVNISFDVFYTVYKYHQDAKRYVLSTGGDEFGHPGVAIYHQGLALVALVSTGDKYWKLEVLGPFRNNDWNNIGIRWQNSETTTGGLELYIDAIKVGQEHYSKPSAPAKGILNPSEMLIGCHKDADNPTYRGYNVADFDEYAYWNRRLPDDQTIFFMGGYEGNIENLTPEEFAHMLSKTNMKDPIQAQIAMTIFNTMADSLKVDDGSQEPANKTLAGNNNGTVPLDSMSLKLRGMADALNKLANPDLIKNDLNLRELGIYMDIIKAASKILNESNAEKWHKIEDNGHRGAPGVKEDVERYIDALGKKLKMEPNNPEPQSFVKFTDNILVKMEKMSVRDYQMRGNSYVSPRYSESPEMRDFWLDWNTPLEKVTVPMALVGGIPECDDYLVSVSTVVYDTMDDVGPSRVSPKSLNDKVVNKLDSRVIRTNVNVYPPLNSATTSKGVSCYPNAQKLNANPVQFTGGHKELRFTIRHPTFHHTELNTDIYKRHCVWWNSQIGVKGAWDSSGCLLLQTTQFYTKCSCKQFGSFAIMAEHMEERIPPYEPGWLRGIKIFLYIISDVLLLFYILVVVFSGDLKDQFHLSGLLLSGCLVGGSVGMLLSDVESIQHSRHNCTAIGTLIQGFYMLSALWVTMLGHAGFKATTRGIIAGRLQSYAAVSFGVTMVLIGISIAFFIHILGTDPRCFISWFGEAKLVLFFFPVVVCLGVSLFFSCVVLFNVNHSKKLNKVIQTDYSSFIVGSTAVIFYFTITWIIAAFSYVKIGDGYSGMYPIFQILNSLMGVVVFISIGIMSTKFRRVLTRTHQRRGEILQKMKEKAKIATEGKAPKNPKDKAIPPPSPPPSPPPPPPPPPTKNQPKPPSPPPNPSLSPSPPNLIDAD